MTDEPLLLIIVFECLSEIEDCIGQIPKNVICNNRDNISAMHKLS